MEREKTVITRFTEEERLEIKLYCVKNKISMQDFCFAAILKALEAALSEEASK